MKIFTILLAATAFVFIAFSASAKPPKAAAPTTPAPAVPAAATIPPPPLDCSLEAVGAIGKSIFNRADMSPEALAKSPIVLHLTIKSTNIAAASATVSLAAEDIFSKPVAINGETQFSVPLRNGEGAKDIPFKAPGPGYFQFTASIQAGSDTTTATADFGLRFLPIPASGPIPLFCTTDGKPDLDLFQAVGLKKDRTCLKHQYRKERLAWSLARFPR